MADYFSRTAAHAACIAGERISASKAGIVLLRERPTQDELHKTLERGLNILTYVDKRNFISNTLQEDAGSTTQRDRLSQLYGLGGND